MVTASRENDKIAQIFTSVQENRTCHAKYIKKLQSIYSKCNFDNFVRIFIDNLRIPLTFMEKAPAIEYVLQFCAKFTISLQPTPEEGDDESDEMCPFVMKIFDFLLSHHNATDKAVRYRICYFLNMVLDTMGDNASIEDDLCTRIMGCMMDRIQDKVPKVRAQAAIALHRLQEPTNPNCMVINVYLFHLAKDPSSEVRRVILAKMAKNKATLHAAIRRTRDVDDSVRKMAYLFISKITAKSLTISQREKLIRNGLKDRSENIKKCVRDILIPSWLRYYDNNYISLMKAIDPEHAPEAVSLALNCLFKKSDFNALIEQLPLDNNKFISMDQLNGETALYWRCLAEFLKTENLDEFERIMPELTPLCTYIRDYIVLLADKQIAKQWEQLTQEFILLQLFEMVKLYDLSDEMGRKNLKELIIDTITSDDCPEKIDECLVKYLEAVVPEVDERVFLLVEVINEKKMPMKNNVATGPIPMTEDERHERKMARARLGVRLLELEDEEYAAIQEKDYVKAGQIQEKVAELRKEIDAMTVSEAPQTEDQSDKPCEERNDPVTLTQCLRIMYYMMQSKTICFLTPTLRTLMESLVIPCLDMQDNNDHVLGWALQAIGLCCHIDRDLAKKYFMIFFVYITESENEELWIIASKVIFDLLLKHGLETFNINHSDDDADTSGSKKGRSVRLYNHTDEDESALEKQIDIDSSHNNVVKVMMALLDSHVQKLQTVAAEGLCKLLLHNRISSSHLITQLLILWHNPTIRENDYLTQCLCAFFPHYVNRVRDSYSVLEEAYLPTLKILANAPDMSPLQEIEMSRVSQVIIGLTSSNISNTFGIHNNLTFIIITEALNPETEIPIDVLIKSLKNLDVQFESQDSKGNILRALDQLEEAISSSNKKPLLTILQNFRQRVITPRQSNSQDLNNPEESVVNATVNATQIEERREENDEEMIIDEDSEEEPDK